MTYHFDCAQHTVCAHAALPGACCGNSAAPHQVATQDGSEYALLAAPGRACSEPPCKASWHFNGGKSS